MTRNKQVAVLLVGAFVVWSPGAADACSWSEVQEFRPDPSEVGVDIAAPEAPVIASVSIHRNAPGCVARTSCDGQGSISVRLEPGVDDRSVSAAMGYRVLDATGRDMFGHDIRLDDDGSFFMIFSDDGQDLDEAYTIVAIDRAGNESEPVTFEVVDEEGGCTAGGSATAWWPLALAALLAIAPRRRRRATP